jgi:hypothetical protein
LILLILVIGVNRLVFEDEHGDSSDGTEQDDNHQNKEDQLSSLWSGLRRGVHAVKSVAQNASIPTLPPEEEGLF